MTYTESDIRKALKCCANKKRCFDCPFCLTSREPCYVTLAREAASLLDRKEAELEKTGEKWAELYADTVTKWEEAYEELEADVDKQYEQAKADILGNMSDGGTSCHWCITQHQVNAIKEFAERLKATPYRFREERTIYFDKPPITKMVLFVDDNDIDKLVKEMTEETP